LKTGTGENGLKMSLYESNHIDKEERECQKLPKTNESKTISLLSRITFHICLTLTNVKAKM
jgi:hypothetical protein